MSNGDYLESTRVFRKPAESHIKLADIDLGVNPQMWFAKIYGSFEAQHPEIYKNMDTVPSLTFSKQDFVAGYALGAMSISAGHNMIVFPVIVRDGRLAPFDLMYVNGQLQYADKDRVGALTNPYRPFKGVSDFESTNGPELLNNTEPYKNKTTINSGKYGSIDVIDDLIKIAYDVTKKLNFGGEHFNIHDIGYTVKDSQLQKLADTIQDNPSYFMGSTPEFKSYVSNLRNTLTKESATADWCDVVMITRDDVNSYTVKKAKIGYDGYVEDAIDSDGVKKIASRFGQDCDRVLDKIDAMSQTDGGVIINSLNDTIERVKVAMDSVEKLAKAGIDVSREPTFKTPGQVDKYGPYSVLLEDGSYDTGTIFPMVDWNFSKSGNFLYVGMKYAIQSRMAGQPSSSPCMPPRGEPRQDTVGTFVYEKPGRAFALPPFEIKAHRHTPSGIAITARSLVDERLLNLVPTDDVKSLVKITRENDPGSYLDGAINVYVPSAMDFIVMPPERGLVIEDPQNAAKMASFYDSPAMRGEHQIKVRNGGEGYFSMDMREFPLNTMPKKIASLNSFRKLDRRTESLPEIYFNIKIAGVTSPDIITDGREGVWNSVYAPTPEVDCEFGKEATIRNNETAWNRVKNIIPHEGIFKIAAAVEASETLDELFALNFMNSDNVEYFMNNLESLDDMNGFLSRLLLGARVSGVHDLSEDEVKGTLRGIVDVKKVLSSFARGIE